MSPLTELNLSRQKRLPIMLSAETAECGLACLAMIGRYHGHDVDLNGLRQRYPISTNGATLRELMKLADQLGFSPRALKVDLESLGKVQMPAVIHWDLNHFVVLKSVSRTRATIHDPARGILQVSLGELSKHYTGIVLELAQAATFHKITAREPIKVSSLWSRSSGFWQAAVQVLGLSAALQIVTFAAPFQIQLVVDEAVGRGDAPLLATLALGFGTLVVVQVTIEALRNWALQVFGNTLTFQMVGNLVRHLLRLPTEFFEKRHVGDLLSRINSTSAVQDALTKGAVSALIDGAMAAVAAIILALYSPLLAAIVLGTVVLSFGATLLFYPAMRMRQEEQLIASANERTHLMESIRSATTIKIMGRETERESAWRNLYANVINATVSVGKYQIGVGAVQSLFGNLSAVLIIFLGAQAILSGRGFSIGMLLAFMSFRQTFSDRANNLLSQGIQFRLLGLHLDRLSDIIVAKPEAESGASVLLEIGGGVALRNVSFRYGHADPNILNDINLDITPGEFVAITGPSGCGKSTLLKIMLGLRAPTEGRVVLDGRPATPELWRAWREQIGVVIQNDQLLSGSIADNIAFLDPVLDMQRVQMAAIAAHIHADIVRMPMQYLSLIGDMGSSLSGGQRQRILLARALYRNPRLLILDEGTSNIDRATEDSIMDVLIQLPITRIAVTHSERIMVRAQRVITLGSPTSADIATMSIAQRHTA